MGYVTLWAIDVVAERVMPSNIPASPSPAPLTPIAVSLFEAARVLPLERDRWLAAGFEPSTALNFLSAGATLEAAVEWRADSLSANDFARYRNLTGTGLRAAQVTAAAWRNAITVGSLDQLESTLEMLHSESGGRRALCIDGVEGEEALDLLNRLDAMRTLDPRTPIQLNNWDLVAVRGPQGERWWLPNGTESNALSDHGGGMQSFGTAYFTRFPLDRFPRALGRHQSSSSALEAMHSLRPMAQIALSWGRRTLGPTGIVWDITEIEQAGAPAFLLSNDEYERARLTDEHHHSPHLAPTSFVSLDHALATAGRASFVVDGLLLASITDASRTTRAGIDSALRSLVPVDSFEFELRGSARPAFMLDGQDYLAIPVADEALPVLLAVARHDDGIVDAVTVFDRHLATFSETDAQSGASSWYALGVTDGLVIELIIRSGEAPRAAGRRERASDSPADLVAAWVRQLTSITDAPDGVRNLAALALAADGTASGTTLPSASDDWPFDFPGRRSPLRGWFDIDLDEGDRLRCAEDLRAHQ